jgi:hypothetical protein
MNVTNLLFSFVNTDEETTDYAQLGYDYLTVNARTFHDFSQLSGSHGNTITTSEDLSPNNRDLTNAPGGFYTPNTPTVFSYKFPNLISKKAHYAFNNQPLLFANNTTNGLYATSHEVDIALTAKSKNFILRVFGVDSTQVYYCQIETTGKITVAIKRASTTTVQRTVDAIFTQTVQNGDLGSVIQFGIECNFTSGSPFLKIRINGCYVATELISGTAVASWDSAYNWNNTFSSAVGAVAAATNTTGNSKAHWNYKFAVNAPMTQDNRNLVVHQILGTDPQGGKLILLADSKMPICTASKSYYIGVYLSEAPSSDVSVAVTGDSSVVITGSSLTFTSSNYNVPQLVKIVGSANFGYVESDISFTYSGGFSGVKTHTVIVAQSRTGIGGKDGSDVYLTDGWNSCRTEADAISIPDAAAFRAAIESTLFKGSYPTGGPETTTTPTAYATVSSLSHANAGSKFRMKFTDIDGSGYEYRNYVGWVYNTSPSNKLFFQFFGHGESFHQEMYNDVMGSGKGYDWAGACMALAVENEHNNPNLTGSPSWIQHGQLFTQGVDTSTFDARRIFLHDKLRFLVHAHAQRAYTHVVVAGVSGGGLLSMYVANLIRTIFPGVIVVFEVRGANSYNTPESGGDWEQGADFLDENRGGAVVADGVYGPRNMADYRATGFLERFAGACADGVDFHQISHELDPLGGSYYIQIPKDIMDSKVANFDGKFYQYVNTDAAQATHGFNTNERAYIIANLP